MEQEIELRNKVKEAAREYYQAVYGGKRQFNYIPPSGKLLGVEELENIQIKGAVNTTIFARLQKLMRETKDVPEFVKKITMEYSDEVDGKLKLLVEQKENKKMQNRAMFSSEIEEKILNKMKG